ncbi:MAG: uroporphyrinogen-III C-methyltransferase [Minicystis sp.]
MTTKTNIPAIANEPAPAADRSSGHSPSGVPGIVYLVGGGPGDPGLITVRGAELLARADVVLHDELVHPALLDHVRAGAEIRFVGKRGGDPGSKQASQAAIEAELVQLAREGRCVVRLKGGDPFMFGRGSEEAEALVAAGVPFEIVPGVTSPIGAAAYAGISLTHRDLASSVTFVSATTRAGAEFDWSELSSLRGTICVLMGMRKLEAHVEGLVRDAKRAPETPAAVIQWGTRSEQRVVEGRLDEIAARAREAGLASPAIIIVGPVVSLRRTLRWFDARPLFGKRVLVTRPAGQAAATSEMLRRRGAEPIELPAIQIGEPPDPERVRKAVHEMGRYDVVAFTSENGVSWFFRAIDAEGKDTRVFGRARVAAIGPGTAAVLAPRGIRADIVPAEFRGEGLAEAILADPEVKARLAAGSARVLVPRALVAREVLAEILRKAGCEVDIVPVYETRPASADRREELLRRLDAGAVDVVMLTSSSTADSLCELLGDRAADRLRNVLVASIGPITTATAEKRGLTVGVTATESTTAGLVAALEHHFAAGTATTG